MKAFLLSFFLSFFLFPLFAEEQRIAILGDSIAYGGGWPARVEKNLKENPKYASANIVNFGLPSETVSGLSEEGHAGGQFPRPCLFDRLDSILKKYKPTMVIACYGMNDGICLPLDNQRFNAFRKGMTQLKDTVEKTGSSFIALTPPLFQADNAAKAPDNYDHTLDAYSEWLVGKKKDGWKVIDIRPSLKKSIEEEKKRHADYVYAGDGVHPADKGHAFIANAILPELGRYLNIEFTAKEPSGEDMKMSNIVKHAWLTETGHKRPGIPQGIPVKCLEAPDKNARISEWHGFIKHDFTLDEGKLNGLVVVPMSPAKGHPWIWRTEFFGHEPQADIELLKKGFYVAYAQVNDMYGSPKSIELMKKFYDHVTNAYKLSPKVILEGFSRGGLYAYNWAAAYPGNVAGLYVDAPVCDFKSWPGGKGKAKPAQAEWIQLLERYGMTEEQALKYKKNPIDNLAPLAKAGIPILAVVGDIDDVVPVAENTAIVEKRYKKLGGRIQVIHKADCNHHPHSLFDPSQIVDFALKCYGMPVPRRIVCIGDSITQGAGCGPERRWSTELGKKLGSSYEITNLGVSARTLLDAGDNPYRKEHAYKMALQMKPEYVFIALGTNDSKPQNWAHKKHFADNYTTMIKELRKDNPSVKIFCLKAIPAFPENYGITDKVIKEEVNPLIEQVAKVNKCKIVDMYTPMLDQGKHVPDKVHPNPDGHAVMADVLYKKLKG